MWETVAEGSRTKVQFDTIGDVFTGEYQGTEEITNPNDGRTWMQYNFRGHSPAELSGELCAINGGFAFRRAFESVPVGSLVRITFIKTVDTGQPTPMKDFKVEVAR